MKISIGKDSFTLEADLSKIGNSLVKTIPQKVIAYFKNRNNIRRIELSIKKLRTECFCMPPKKFRYKKYVLPVPRTAEQIRQDFENTKYIDEKIHSEFLDKRLDEDTAEHTMLQRFYAENGGSENFVCFYQKGIKINGYSMQAFKYVYTYSKNDKAVFINEQFRKSDNSYCLFGYCTKNFTPERL